MATHKPVLPQLNSPALSNELLLRTTNKNPPQRTNNERWHKRRREAEEAEEGNWYNEELVWEDEGDMEEETVEQTKAGKQRANSNPRG
mmetsp:Transcript_70777/g.198024  ORF Transcript_70777/g.198024 Transcript_70777/m.198024 type:complete len:88 (-) Transcript_70777:118-381(-)